MSVNIQSDISRQVHTVHPIREMSWERSQNVLWAIREHPLEDICAAWKGREGAPVLKRRCPDNWRSIAVARLNRRWREGRGGRLPLARLILIARTWFAAAHRGHLRGGRDVRCPRTPATCGSGARIACGTAAGTSRGRSARGTARSQPRAGATATAAARRSRTTASRSRGTSSSSAARTPWTPTRRTPCRPPGRSWRGRVTALPRLAPEHTLTRDIRLIYRC